jgi:hypothetical protein
MENVMDYTFFSVYNQRNVHASDGVAEEMKNVSS